MPGPLKSILSSPVFIEDQNKTRTARVLHVTLWALLVLTVLYLAIAILFLPGPDQVVAPGIVTIVLIVGVWLLMRRGYVWESSWLWISALWILITLFVLPFDGVGSAVFSAYIVPIVFAALLLDGRAANAYTLLSIAAGLILLSGSLSGILPRDPDAYATDHLAIRWLVNSVLFVVVVIMAQQAKRSMDQALRDAQESARALADAQALLRAAIDQSPAGIIVADAPDVQIRLVNQAALATRGGDGEGLTGIAVDHHAARWQTFHLDGVTPYDPKQLPLSRAILQGEVVRSEEVIIRNEAGENRWVSANAAPIFDADGRIRAGIVVFLDITERQQAREALERYANRLELLRKIDQTILEAETPRAIAQAALRQMSLLIPYQGAAVSLFDYRRQHATLLGMFAHGEIQTDANQTFSLNGWEEMFETLWKGEVWSLEDAGPTSLPASWPNVAQGTESQSIVFVPLLIQDELIGALHISADVPRAFTPEHIEIAGEIADELAIAIQQAQLHEKIRFHAAELERRVTERTIELRRANEHLTELSHAKDQFVSNVSHELRTPITNLKLRQHLLKVQPNLLEEHLGVLRRETDRLEELIENLLMLSRLDQNRVRFNFEPVDLNELAAEYVSDRASMAQSRQLVLLFETVPNLPPVSADWHMIGQVLSILLTNALLYTPAGGEISVTTHQRHEAGQNWAGFSIRDTGPGIAEDERHKLFTRFFRGDVGLKSGVSGTGLGLAIAKEIIDHHRGEIIVESADTSSHGTTFTVWLPETRPDEVS